MKKENFLMSILLVCLLSVGLTSCSSDDDGGGSTPTPLPPLNLVDIVGTWQCSSSIDTVQGESVPGLMVGLLVTINENGTYTSTFPGFGNSGTFTLSGNTIAAQSSAGTFTAVASITDNIMHWSGSSSSGETFQYNFTRVANDAEE